MRLVPGAPPITVRACGTETNLPLVAQPVADPGEPADAAGPVVAVEAAEIDRVDESMPLRSFGVSLVVAGAATVITIALLLLA